MPYSHEEQRKLRGGSQVIAIRPASYLTSYAATKCTASMQGLAMSLSDVRGTSAPVTRACSQAQGIRRCCSPAVHSMIGIPAEAKRPVLTSRAGYASSSGL